MNNGLSIKSWKSTLKYQVGDMHYVKLCHYQINQNSITYNFTNVYIVLNEQKTTPPVISAHLNLIFEITDLRSINQEELERGNVE